MSSLCTLKVGNYGYRTFPPKRLSSEILPLLKRKKLITVFLTLTVSLIIMIKLI